MNIASMVEFHEHKRAQVTGPAIPGEKRMSTELGGSRAQADGRLARFHEKRPGAPTIPGEPVRVDASMGNDMSWTRTLLRELQDDAANESSSHDFGRDILPSLVGRSEVYAYNFQSNRIPGERAEADVYWRDVGTIDAYYEANMDLRSVSPAL